MASCWMGRQTNVSGRRRCAASARNYSRPRHTLSSSAVEPLHRIMPPPELAAVRQTKAVCVADQCLHRSVALEANGPLMDGEARWRIGRRG